MGSFYEEEKDQSGRFATYAWILSGIYLFAVEPSAHFLSWKSALFFLGGMFAAALVFGILGYALQRFLAKGLLLTMKIASLQPSRALAAFISFLGLVLMLVNLAFVFFAAKFSFDILMDL